MLKSFFECEQTRAFPASPRPSPPQWGREGAERSALLAEGYPRNPDGTVRKYDDLPAVYHDNVNIDPPFDRKPGEKPALDAAEIDDIIAFLGTLTDGYKAPKRP